MSILRVLECFDSIQGEGPLQGRPCRFLRLAGCNLRCDFCDTPYAQTSAEAFPPCHLSKFSEYVPLNEDLPLVLTGGEPLLQQASFVPMLQAIDDASGERANVWFETNGTILPQPELYQYSFVVSPKAHALNESVLQTFANLPRTYFKFVIGPSSGWGAEEILPLLRVVDRSRIYLMPQGGSREELQATSPAVWNLCVAHGFRFSSRMHVWVFDKERGV